MIDILEQLISIVSEEFPDVYRAWPEVRIKGKTYAVVARAGRNPQLYNNSSDGEELITNLSYTLTLFGPDPVTLDTKINALAINFNKLRIRLNSISSVYSLGADMYSLQANLSVTVDKRGNTYH